MLGGGGFLKEKGTKPRGLIFQWKGASAEGKMQNREVGGEQQEAGVPSKGHDREGPRWKLWLGMLKERRVRGSLELQHIEEIRAKS